MKVVVPYAAHEPKTRLAGTLSEAERAAFAEAMLADVLDAIRATGHDPKILSTAPLETDFDATVRTDDRPLSPAINAVLADADEPVAIVMADLALATPDALSRLFDTDADVAVAPGRGGGTNALVVRHDEFRVDYHGASYLDHRQAARDVDATVEVVDSHRLATDVDERADLAEVLLHGEGRAVDWLREAGFSLLVDDGRVEVARE
ncbi:2-phospho-L-lactate guanylyltransferase [Halorussus halophilus]|uniref:2-phospho-L-lactate guanylyltransferase n=1 Tax=Halorussus halophilus TaxID=2650975 RepID=UPI001301974E|nr:2-phospho-L-lactate guanylyltransferase [Halorussus halophilus]